MSYPYTYNIASEFDTEAFWGITRILDDTLPANTRQELVEDFLDGSLLKIYHTSGSAVRVECNWDIGAVFIDSEINLDAIIGSDEA